MQENPCGARADISLVRFNLLYYTFIMLKSVKRDILFAIVFAAVFSVHAKPKNRDLVYQKAVHPREYVFDLCDFSTQFFLGLNKSSGLFENEIDFTDYVRNDMPRRGDKISFYFSGTSTKDAHNMFAQLVLDHERREELTRQFASNVVRKQYFEGFVSFVLPQDVNGSLKLRLYSDMPNRPGHIDQTYFRFKRVVESTNTAKEAEAEKKALRQKIEIQEVRTEIVDDYQQKAESLGVTDRQDSDDAVDEDALERERQEALRLAQERERENQERLQMELAQIRQTASGGVSRYSKEYLSDYVVYDSGDVSDDAAFTYEAINNPDEADSFGRTLLMKAAKAGNDWQVKSLLEAGAKVNLKDRDGWTALMYAARYQEGLECVQLLMGAGADVKAKNAYGSSALVLASCYNNNPDIIRRLLAHYGPSDKEVLRSFVMLLSESQTSEYVQISKIRLFLDMGVPLNAFYEGKTPLMYAAQFGSSTNVLRCLLDGKAMPGLRSTEGKTAFDYAKDNNNLEHDSVYWALNSRKRD